MNELVKIAVELEDGRKLYKKVTINSDGSYVEVDRLVRELVKKEFKKSAKIANIGWWYA